MVTWLSTGRCWCYGAAIRKLRKFLVGIKSKRIEENVIDGNAAGETMDVSDQDAISNIDLVNKSRNFPCRCRFLRGFWLHRQRNFAVQMVRYGEVVVLAWVTISTRSQSESHSVSESRFEIGWSVYPTKIRILFKEWWGLPIKNNMISQSWGDI